MWSKTRKALYERMASSLRGRVTYVVQVYQQVKCGCSMCGNNYKQFAVVVDKTKVYTIGGAGAFFYDEIWNKVLEEYHLTNGMIGYWETDPGGKNKEKVNRRMFYYTGTMLFSDLIEKIHIYLNFASIEECLSKEDYFLYLLTIFDRRVGKRKIKEIYEQIDSEPEWIRKFIRLRAEGID